MDGGSDWGGPCFETSAPSIPTNKNSPQMCSGQTSRIRDQEVSSFFFCSSVRPMPGRHDLLESAPGEPWNEVHPRLDSDQVPTGLVC